MRRATLSSAAARDCSSVILRMCSTKSSMSWDIWLKDASMPAISEVLLTGFSSLACTPSWMKLRMRAESFFRGSATSRLMAKRPKRMTRPMMIASGIAKARA